RRRSGPEARRLETLSSFWARPEHAAVARELDLPHDDWETMAACWQRLSNAEVHHGRMAWVPAPTGPEDEPWLAVARGAEALAAADPVTAAVISLFALAAGEGALGHKLLAP